MSDEKTAWNAVKYILTNNVTLAVYVKKIFEGDRESVMDSEYPCIIMEDAGEDEINKSIGNQKLITMRIALIAGIKILRPDLQIVGDSLNKGILDFTSDIKNALDTYVKLDYDGTPRCVSFMFPDTQNGDILQSYPYRFRRISMEIKLATNFASR